MGKMLALYIGLLSLISFSVQAIHCFSNEAEYKAIKDQLPPILQNIPVYMGFKGLVVKAAGNIRFDAGNILFFFNCNFEIERPIEDTVSICVTQSTVDIKFESTVTESIRIVSNSQVSVREKVTLALMNKDDYTKIERVLPNGRTSQINPGVENGVGANK